MQQNSQHPEHAELLASIGPNERHVGFTLDGHPIVAGEDNTQYVLQFADGEQEGDDQPPLNQPITDAENVVSVPAVSSETSESLSEVDASSENRGSFVSRNRRLIITAQAAVIAVLAVGVSNVVYDAAGGTDGERFINYANPAHIIDAPIDDAKAIGRFVTNAGKVIKLFN